MAESLGDAVLNLRTDDSGLEAGIDRAEGRAEGLAGTFDRVGGRVSNAGRNLSMAVTLPLMAFGTMAIGAASDAQELQSAFDATFGAMAGAMNEWARETGDAMGRSTQEMQTAANMFGIFFNQAAPTREVAADMSRQFAILAQDLSSFFNVDPTDAMARLRSGLSGESEPLRDFGVFLTEANVQAQAFRMGLVGVGDELTEQEKIMARAALIMEATRNAQGDVARTQGSTANQVRAANAAWDELQVTIGTQLLPVVTPLISSVGDLLNMFGGLPPGVQTAAVAALGLAAALGPLLMGIGAIMSGIGAAIPLFASLGGGAAAAGAAGTVATGAMGGLLAILGPVAIGVAALVAAWVLFGDQIGPVLSAFWDRLQTVLGPQLIVLFDTVKAALTELWQGPFGDAMRVVIDMLGEFAAAYTSVLGDALIRILSGLVAAVTSTFETVGGIFRAVAALLRGDPAQRWTEHAAPVRRNIADITADRQPREARLALGYVIWAEQAGRVAEVSRRLGRLFGRATVTLPPRFSGIEEGDWVQWMSARRFGGATRTFRVEAWGSDQGWKHTLTLRQISASVYSPVAPLSDGTIAAQPPPPPEIAAPGAASWALNAGQMSGGGIASPALIITGTSDDQSARFIRIEYVQGTEAPTATTVWSDAGVAGPDIKRREIAVAAGGIYHVSISYIVDGVQGARLILGPVTATEVTYPDGTPIADVQPAGPGATRGALLPGLDEPHASNILRFDGDPWQPQELLNTALALQPHKDGFALAYAPLAGAPEIVSVIRTADTGAAEQSALAQRDRQLDDIAEQIVLLAAARRETQRVFRDAGVVVDPATGVARLYALDQTNERLTNVSVTLDAVESDILLRATTSYVDSAIAQAVIDPSQVPVFTQLEARVGAAEIAISGANAAITQRATLVQLAAEQVRITNAEQRIGAVEGAITTKVEAATFGALEGRVTSAEQAISAFDSSASISDAVRSVALLDRSADDTAEQTLLGLIRDRTIKRQQVEAVADARREIATKVNDDLAVEAAARTALSGRVSQAEAGLIAEQVVRAAGDTALSQAITVVSTRVGNNEASIATINESIDGIAVRSGVRLDVNGHITGFEQFNNGSQGGAIFRTDYFGIVTPGGTPKPMFEATAQGVSINAAFVRNLRVAPNANSTIFLPVVLEPLIVRGTHGQVVQYDSGRSFGSAPARIIADLSALPALAQGERYEFRPTSITATSFVPVVVKIAAGSIITQQQSGAGADAGAGTVPRWRASKPTPDDANDFYYSFSFSGSLPKVSEYADDPFGSLQYVASYGANFDLFGRTAAGWVILGTISLAEQRISDNSQLNPPTIAFSQAAIVQSSADLEHGAASFGVQPSAGSAATITGFAGVEYQTVSGATETPVMTPLTFTIHPPR